MTIDLDRIEELAKGATKGPWEAKTLEDRDGSDIEIVAPVGRPGRIAIDDLPVAQTRTDYRFIAALSPDVVLRMVAVCRCAKERSDFFRHTVELLTEEEMLEGELDLDIKMEEALAGLDGVES